MSKYGFIPDPTLTVFQNACKLVRDTEWMSYHSRPSNLKFHDLTDGKTMGRPVGVLVDARGGLVVADDLSNTVWRIAPSR